MVERWAHEEIGLGSLTPQRRLGYNETVSVPREGHVFRPLRG